MIPGDNFKVMSCGDVGREVVVFVVCGVCAILRSESSIFTAR